MFDLLLNSLIISHNFPNIFLPIINLLSDPHKHFPPTPPNPLQQPPPPPLGSTPNLNLHPPVPYSLPLPQHPLASIDNFPYTLLAGP